MQSPVSICNHGLLAGLSQELEDLLFIKTMQLISIA